MAEEAKGVLTAEIVRSICGTISDWKIKDILATGASVKQLEEAAAWAAGDDEHTPRRNLPPQGPAATIHEILVAGEDEEENWPGPQGA